MSFTLSLLSFFLNLAGPIPTPPSYGSRLLPAACPPPYFALIQSPGSPSPDTSLTGTINSRSMRPADYHVASATQMPRYKGNGGWDNSDNKPRPVAAGPATRRKAFQVVVDPQPAGTEPGLPLRIVNTTRDTVVFPAQDSRLRLNLQARNSLGQWKDIEYIPNSWCANGRHYVYLAPQQYWLLRLPVYSGTIPTQLRAKLVHKKGQDLNQDVVVYSNEFAGSVNPGQLGQ